MHDLLGRLEVVAGDRLLEVAAGAGVLTGVDVDDGHRLGAVDDERAAAGQPYLPLQCLDELLVDPVRGEHVLAAVGQPLLGVRFGPPPDQPVRQVRRDVLDVLVDDLPADVSGDDQLAEVLVEHVPDDTDGQVGLTVEEGRRRRGLGLLLDVLPLRGQPRHVALKLGLRRAFGGGADDNPGVVRRDLLEDVLEPVALGVGQLAADPGHRRAGHVHQVPAGQADLAGEPGALVAHRVLGDLDDHRLARLERRLDALGLALKAAGVEVDLAGVEHGVAALADVDERRLHRGQHVLHLAEVHVAHVGLVRGPVHVVLDEDAVLQHRDLGAVAALADHHGALDGLAPGQELRLGDDRRPAAAGLAALAAALLLGLQPGGSLDRADVVGRVMRLAHVHDSVRRVIRRADVDIS